MISEEERKKYVEFMYNPKNLYFLDIHHNYIHFWDYT